MKNKILTILRHTFFIFNLLLLTVGTVFLGQSDLLIASGGILTASFSNGTPSSSGYYCRGYFFTPTQDLYVQSVYGNVTDGTFTLGVWNVSSHTESSTVLGNRIINHTMSSNGKQSFAANGTIFYANQTYLIVQGRTSGNGSHVITNKNATNDELDYINFQYGTTRIFSNNVTCDFNNNASSTSYSHSDAGSTRVDVGFTYVVNSINFISNAAGVNNPSSIVMPAGSSLSNESLPNVNRTGYLFEGWFDASSGGSKILNLPAVMPTGILDYYAQWTPITYTVNFDGNTSDSGTMDSILATYDQPFNLPINDFIKIGHSFHRWDSQANGGGTSYTDQSSLSNLKNESGSSITLYAQWNIDNYTLTFNTDGGSSVSSFNIDFANDLIIPATTKTGYNFAGWYDDENLSVLFDYVTMPAIEGSTLDLYAKWEPKTFTVGLNHQGGASEINTIIATFDDSMPTIASPIKVGFTFLGYYSDVNGKGDKYYNRDLSSARIYVTDQAITLYAFWSPKEFSKNYLDENYDFSSEFYNSDVFDQMSTLSGIQLLSTAVNGTSNFISYKIPLLADETGFSSYFQFNSSSTLADGLAIIFSNHPITVAGSPGGALGYPPTFSAIGAQNFSVNLDWYTRRRIYFRDSISSPIEENPNVLNMNGFHHVWIDYEFTETGGNLNIYYLHSSTDSEVNKPNAYTLSVSVIESFTKDEFYIGITAATGGSKMNLWLREMSFINTFIQSHTISFETNGGNAIDSITQEFNSEVSAPANPDRTGYTFAGWFSDSELETPYVFDRIPSFNLTLYAKWNLIDYSIIYHLNGGEDTIVNPSSYHIESSTILLSLPEKTGYTFRGWFDNSAFSGAEVEEIQTGSHGDLNLYALWEINEYTLSFNANGGSSTSDITADYLSDITLPTPSRQGYRFDGWFEEGIRVTYTEMPLENRTLEARWTALPYTLTFVNSITGEQTTLTASFNAPIQMPQINQPGYTFGGWLESNRPVSFTSMPLGNRTLVASFNARNYTISFSSSLGTAPSSIEAAYQSSVSLPTMSVEHHIFKGWQGPNGLIQGSFQVPLNGASLTAVFEPKTYTLSFAGDGINIPSMEIPFEGALSLPTPSKEGYRFTGWLLNGSPATLTQMPGENITLTATFERIELTLRLISEGQVIRQSTHLVNDSFTLPSPQKRGHTFEGWFEGNTRVMAGAMPSRNLTLNARFLINSYPVTFIDYDSSETSRYEYESTLELPQKERLGYQFMGWSLNGEIIDNLTISDTVVELTAVYQPFTARMTFASPTQVFTLNITTDQSLSNISTMSVPSGYVWQGFYTMPFGAGDSVIDGFMVDNAHEVSMYPYYLRAGQAFEVSRGRLSVDPYYSGEVHASEGSEHRFPWFEVVSFITLSSALITLHVISKGGKVHENL